MSSRGPRGALLALAVVPAVALLVAGCGGTGGAGAGGGESEGGTATSTQTVTRTSTATASGIQKGTPAHTALVSAYFVKEERLSPEYRRVPLPRVAHEAMEQLLAGPRSSDLGTAIPAGTKLRGVHVEGGTATVDLTDAYVSGGGSLSMQERVAQVVYTLTQFHSVSGVLFEIEGQRVETIGGEGLIVSEPVTREQYSEFAPAP